MSKRSINKEDFYPELVRMMALAKKSIRFYSISCCFGFYSRGLGTFENVLLELKASLRRMTARNYLDVRVLLKTDRDNPIDMFAAERLAHVEKVFARTGKRGNRNVFRELGPDCRQIQFIIVDSNDILVSEIQEEIYNDDLELELNKSERGLQYEKADDPDAFLQLSKYFDDSWNITPRLDVPVRNFSRRKLKFLLERYRGTYRANTERELHLLLMGYLQGLFDPSIVDLESPAGATRIDLLIGKRPHFDRQGIEVKFKSDNDAINGIVGQMRNYRKDYEDLVLVVGKPQYNLQQRARLVHELEAADIGLVELL